MRAPYTSHTLVFILLIGLHLMPIWAFTYFPSEDGLSHINNANVIREYHHPDHAIFREYYVLNKHPVPNWFSHIVMAGLRAFTIFHMVCRRAFSCSGYIAAQRHTVNFDNYEVNTSFFPVGSGNWKLNSLARRK
jgi:hypothetical protein